MKFFLQVTLQTLSRFSFLMFFRFRSDWEKTGKGNFTIRGFPKMGFHTGIVKKRTTIKQKKGTTTIEKDYYQKGLLEKKDYYQKNQRV